MDKQTIFDILQQVQSGTISVEQAQEQLRWQPIQHLDGFAQIDTHRTLRQNMPEFIYAEHKTPEQTAQIAVAQVAQSGCVLISRANPDHYEAVKGQLPNAVYHTTARVITIGEAALNLTGTVIVVAALIGTTARLARRASRKESSGTFLGSRPDRPQRARGMALSSLLER